MKKLLLVIPVCALFSCQPKTNETTDANPELETPAKEVPAASFDVTKTDTLIGQPLTKVQAACDAAKVTHRVVEMDGKPLPATMDIREERLNFAVKDGMIVKVTKG